MQTLEPVQTFDPAKAEAFAGRMVDILNSAAIAIMTSIGHRTALFDTLAVLPPATSEAIAIAAGLNERYVREWLGSMMSARLVDYDPGTKTYSLPAEHATFLTRTTHLSNIAGTAQFIATERSH